MEKTRYLFMEGIKNIWRHKVTTFTAIFSLFIIIYIVGIFSIFGNNTHKMLHYLRSKYKIEVFFNQNISNQEAVTLIHKIKKIDGVRTATIIEKEDAIRIFKDQFGENIIELLGYNPLPVSAVVNIERARRDRLRIEPIIKEIRSISQIDEIRYQGNLINKIEKNYKRGAEIVPYIALFTSIIAALIIFNTIKLSVFSRKELIKTLQLIGASRMFIKLPFIIEGVCIGVTSVIIVIPSLFLTVELINYGLANFSSLLIKINFDPFMMIWILVTVIFLSIIGSYRAASSFLK